MGEITILEALPNKGLAHAVVKFNMNQKNNGWGATRDKNENPFFLEEKYENLRA